MSSSNAHFTNSSLGEVSVLPSRNSWSCSSSSLPDVPLLVVSSDAVSLVEEVTDDAAEEAADELPDLLSASELLSASASAFSFATRS